MEMSATPDPSARKAAELKLPVGGVLASQATAQSAKNGVLVALGEKVAFSRIVS